MPPERSDIGKSAGSNNIGISTYYRYTHPNLYIEILKWTKQTQKKNIFFSRIVNERPPILFKRTNISFTVTKIVKRYVKHYRDRLSVSLKLWSR